MFRKKGLWWMRAESTLAKMRDKLAGIVNSKGFQAFAVATGVVASMVTIITPLL